MLTPNASSTAGLRASASASLPPEISQHALTIEIGGLAIRLRTPDPEFCSLLAGRYSSFLRPDSAP